MHLPVTYTLLRPSPSYFTRKNASLVPTAKQFLIYSRIMYFFRLLYLEKSLPVPIIEEGAWHQVLDYGDRKIESPLSRSCEELLLGPYLLFRPGLLISLVIIYNLSIKLNPLLFTHFLPHALKGVDVLLKDGSLLAICHKIRLQHHLPCICCANLNPNDHASLALRQQYQNLSAALHRLVPIVHMEEHDDVDVSQAPSVCTNSLSSDSSNKSVARQRPSKRSLSRKNSCPATSYCSKWSEPYSACKRAPVVDQLTKILSQRATQVKEHGGWGLIAETGENGSVLCVLQEP